MGWQALVSTGVMAFGGSAAQKATSTAITQAAKGAAKGGLKKKAIGAAKGMAKDKAIEAVTGRGKKKGDPQKISAGGGRGDLVKAQTKSVTPMLPPSDDTPTGGGDGGAIVSKSSEGGKISFGGINKQIDNIVGLTDNLKNAFETQTKQKENQQKVLRKELEKKRKAAREELLESKKSEDTPVKGTEEKTDKKAGFLGTVWKFLSNIIMGTFVVSFLKLATLAKDIFGRASAGMEALFWGIRSLFLFPKTLIGAVKGLRDLLKFSLKVVLDPLKKFGKTIFNSLKSAGDALRTFIGGKVKAALDFVKNLGGKAAQWVKDVGGKGAQWVKNLDVTKKAGNVLNRGKDALKTLQSPNVVKGTGNLLRRGGNLIKGAGNLLSSGASSAVKGITSTITAPIKAVSSGIKTVSNVASKVTAGAQSGLQAASKTAGKVAGKVGGFITKLFPGLGKLIAKGAPIFKGMANAAKGIKIPVVGPIMVAVSSLLAGEPLGQVGFKTMGAGIGGALGSLIPIPVLGTIVGEMAGEFVGDLAYSLFMGGGMEEVKAKAAKKMQDILKTGTEVKDFVVGGFGRFFKNFMKEHRLPIPAGGGVQWALGKLLPGLAEDGLVTSIPNLLQLYNPLAMFPLLKKSFFPPKEEEVEGKLKPAEVSDGGGSKVSKDVKSISKDDPTQETGDNIVIMDSSDSEGSGGGAAGGGGGGGSTTPPAIIVSAQAIASTLNKQETLGALYQS